MSLDQVRAIADAVLYEGYLLYPYRASSHKNRSRWQFGVLGPPRATAASFGEEPEMEVQCLLAPHDGPAAVTVHLRFLQLQVREVRSTGEDGVDVPVGQLIVDGVPVMSWDEAVEREVVLTALPLDDAVDAVHEVAGGEDTEPVTDARGRWWAGSCGGGCRWRSGSARGPSSTTGMCASRWRCATSIRSPWRPRTPRSAPR